MIGRLIRTDIDAEQLGADQTVPTQTHAIGVVCFRSPSSSQPILLDAASSYPVHASHSASRA